MKSSASVLALAFLLPGCTTPGTPREQGPFELARAGAFRDANPKVRRHLLNDLEGHCKRLQKIGAVYVVAFVQSNVVLFSDAQIVAVNNALATFEKNSNDPKETVAAFYARQGATIRLLQQEFNLLSAQGM